LWFDLYPVDRNIEVEILIRQSARNSHLPGKPTLLFSSQLFGAGKTFFAKNAIEILRRDHSVTGPITKSLATQDYPLSDEDNRCNLKSLRGTSFTEDEIIKYCGAITVIVDFRNIINIVRGKILKVAIYRQIYIEGCKIKDQNNLPDFSEMSPETLLMVYFIFLFVNCDKFVF
jgi:hypothetical protein